MPNEKISDVQFLAERWRNLVPEQQAHVDAWLTRAIRDNRRWCERAHGRATHRTSPWAGFAAEKSFIHAANQGAAVIARDLLRAVGCADDRRPRKVAAKICDQCGGHGRVPCECLPKQFDDVSELVGQVDCELCRGDGDFACPDCMGSGAVMEVEK